MRRRKNGLRNNKLRLAAWLIFLALSSLITSHGAYSHEPAVSGQMREAQRREVRIPIHDFVLTDQNGRPFDFKAVRDKVVVLAFAYTTCPDVCPLITAAMRRVQTELKENEHRAVYFLTVTTDPEVDQPKVLAAYAKRYGADLSEWAFLTGNKANLQRIWTNFGVRVVRRARGLIDHTSLTAVIDGTGTIRFAYYGTAPDPKIVLQDVRSLLAPR
jgi:protein SCO1/2